MSAVSSDRHVFLRGGLCVPLEPLQLLLNLEGRGFQLGPKDDAHIWVRPFSRLTEDDAAGLRRWRHHLRALMAYQPLPPKGPMTVVPTNIAAALTMTTVARDTTKAKLRPTDRVKRTVDARLCSQRVLEFGREGEGSNGTSHAGEADVHRLNSFVLA
jgi:hypothetical protein